MQADAIMTAKFNKITKNGDTGTKDVQCPAEEEGHFTLHIDAAMDMEHTYTFDGTVDDDDHPDIHGYISVGCTKSDFLVQIFGESAGVCTAEIIFVDDEHFIGVVTAEGK